MQHVAIALLIIALSITFAGIALRGSGGGFTFDCSAWPSVEECIREGMAPNWRQIQGVEFIGPATLGE